MSESMVSKDYLLGTKVSFLIISFIIGVIAFTVKNDIWPFLLTSLPPKEIYSHWSYTTIAIGILLPVVWLVMDWSNKVLRYGLVSLLFMLLMQAVTEALVTRYFFLSMVIPTAILYGGYRIIQLIGLQRIVFRTTYASKGAKLVRGVMVGANLLFWGVVWIQFAFLAFPQIIDGYF